MLNREKRKFLKAIKKKYGTGNEFKAAGAFGLLSAAYYKWFKEIYCPMTNTRCIDYTESGALQIMEELRAEGHLKKRVEKRNEWGDENWYYTLVK